MVTRSESVDFAHYSYDFIPFEKFAEKKPEKLDDFTEAGWSYESYKSILSGYDATVYVNNYTKEVVIAYAGTNIREFADYYNDLCVGVDSIPPQFNYALATYTEFKNKYPDYEFTLTGHSLGGILVQLVAAVTDERAITFNTVGAAHLLPLLAENYDVSLNPASYTNITNYNLSGDWLNEMNIGYNYQQLGTSYIIPYEGDNILQAHNAFEELKSDNLILSETWCDENYNKCSQIRKEYELGSLIMTGSSKVLPLGGFISRYIRSKTGYRLNDSFTEAEGTRFTPAQDPLLLDLDGDGIETTSVEEGVYFDHGNDGFEELSAWVGSDDGILVHDKNNNCVIDNGNEMFGDNYTKLDGTVATQGFDALSDFDTNSDGVINAQDTDFDSIKVLKGDGTLLSLTDAGISSISLTKTNTNVTDSNGNVRYYNGTFVRTDNTTGTMGDYDMAYDSITTIAKEWLEVPEAIAELPDIAGMGNVYSLHQAMVRDSELKTMVESFVNASDTRTRQGIVEGLIYRWTGVENVESDSRGGLIDAKKLEALEKVVGRGFVGMNISNVQNSTNPIGNAAQVLQNTFTMLMEYVYAELASQTILKPLFEELDFVYNEDLGKYEYDLTSVRGVIDTAIEENPTAGKALLLDFAKSFVNLGLVDVSNYADFKSYYTVQGEDYELLFGSVESINMYGTSEGDVLDGTSEQETIFGYDLNLMAA